ncbi:MAG: rhomboid family intramembrane serine protease [Flavobacteriales bacterium]|nr:rhomboid family intramembrane serine protease [Flavobacteriales bacterium]
MFAASPITFIIIGITALISWQAFNNSTLFEKLLHYPYRVKHNKEYYRLLSHMLVHADFFHLFLNMFVLYSFGVVIEAAFTDPIFFKRFFPEVEPFFGLSGVFAFIVLYIGGGVFATLPSMRKHSDNFGYTSVGASGAVSSLLMAFMFMFPTMGISIMFIPMPAYVGIIVFFLAEFFMMRSGKTRIAHDAHMWGAVFGIIFIAVTRPIFILKFIDSIGNEISKLF